MSEVRILSPRPLFQYEYVKKLLCCNMMDGWICLDKPQGISSNLAMVKVRRIVGQNTGYIGTLDPFATGVLPIAVGEARKFIKYLEDVDKEYVFTVSFGAATDTLDRDGQITAVTSKIPDKNDVAVVIKEFHGEIEQTPPVFSAIKIGGRRACDLARAGKTPDLKSRKVKIRSIRIIDDNLANNQMTFDVICSKGTYIRSLAADIAERLGSLCHVKQLRRTKSGFFSIHNSIPLEKLMEMVDTGEATVVPIDKPLIGMSALHLNDDQVVRLRNGLDVSDAVLLDGQLSLVRIMSAENGEFCGVGAVALDGKLRPARMCFSKWGLRDVR